MEEEFIKYCVFGFPDDDPEHYVQLLNDSNVNYIDQYGYTFLHYLCWNIKPWGQKTIYLLLKKGADANIRDKLGYLPLDLLLENNNFNHELAVVLMKYTNDGPNNIDEMGNTCIFTCKNISALKFLTKHGAILNHINNKFFTVLDIFADDREISSFLCSLGAKTYKELFNRKLKVSERPFVSQSKISLI